MQEIAGEFVMVFRGRKGDLMNNFLGVLIAVIGIALLGFAVVRIWSAGLNQQTQNAKSMIDSLEAKVNLINNGETGEVLLQGFEGSDNWYILGFDSRNAIRPDKCFFKTCICICNLDSLSYFGDGTIAGDINAEGAKRCQDSGVCRFFDVKKIDVNERGNSAMKKVKIGNFNAGTMIPLQVNRTSDAIDILDVRGSVKPQ